MVENQEMSGRSFLEVDPHTQNNSGTVDNRNHLKQLALGGLVGAVVGTVAIALTDKKVANNLSQKTKNLVNTVKGATTDINNTLKNKADKVSFEGRQKFAIQPPIETEKADEETINLHEERLIVSKKQVKTGEVAIAKQIETDSAQIYVLLAKERLVIEKIPVDHHSSVSEANFIEGELVNIELYEQTAEIEKQIFVHEQVRVHKQIDYEAIAIEAPIRREKLDFNIQSQNGATEEN